MKHIRLFEEMINEIGDASAKPFKWKKTSGLSAKRYKKKIADENFLDEVSHTNTFEFTTDKGTEYVLDIEIDSVYNPGTNKFDLGAIQCEIDFITKNRGGSGVNMDATNMHEQYAVMSTITDIFIKWVNEWDQELYINKIVIDPIKDDDDDYADRTDNQRGRLYYAFMKKQLSKLKKKYHVRVFNDIFEISPRFINMNDPAYK
mgnify:CR=1 FL=1